MASTIATPLETEFGQMLPGLTQMTSASVLGTTQITLQFSLDTSLANAETLVLEAINAAQGSLPKDMPTPPTFRAINPADSPIMILAMQSDQAPITDVDNYAENVVEQQISQLAGCRSGSGRRPADALHPRTGRSRKTGIDGHDAGGCPHRPDQCHGRRPEGQHRRAGPVLHHLRQRPAHQGRALQQRHHRLSQRRSDPHSRHRPRHPGPAEPRAWRMDQRQAIHPAAGLQAAERQRHRDRRWRAGEAAPACRPTSRPTFI